MNTKKSKKLILNSKLQPYQILKNDDQKFILCLSYVKRDKIKLYDSDSAIVLAPFTLRPVSTLSFLL